jgi:PKD repeat protein
MKSGNLLSYLAIICVNIFLTTELNAVPDLTRSVIMNGSYNAISVSNGATVSSATGDNAIENSIPIGFTFNYLGINYTTIGVSTNGFAAFSGISADANNMDLYSTSGPVAVLAPWWDDLSVVSGTGEILYKTQGNAGSQTFTVQWTNVNSFHSGSTALLNFQLILYEQTSKIEFRYGDAPLGNFNTASESACIGIKNLVGGSGQFIDAVTGSSYTGNAMLCAKTTWPNHFFRFLPGMPVPLAGGTYTVGNGGDYSNLSEAIAAINHCGVAGTVIFSLTDSLYDETDLHGNNFFPLLVGPVSGTSILSSVNFHSPSGTAIISSPGSTAGNCVTQNSPVAIDSTDEPVIAFIGCDFISMNNLRLRSSTINPDRGILLFNSPANHGVRNCGFTALSIALDRANENSVGVEQKTLGAVSSFAGSNSWNVYQSITISDAYSGFRITGNANFPDSSTAITSCTIGGPVVDDIGNGSSEASGIYASYQNSIFVSGNLIRNVSVNGNSPCTGIHIETADGSSEISANRIYNIRNHSGSSTATVIGVSAGFVNNNGGNTFLIYNNFISGLNSDYSGSSSTVVSTKGLLIQPGGGSSSSNTFHVDFNNVNIHTSSLLISSACFESGTVNGPVINMRNNIFSNSTAAQTGSSAHYCIVSPAANSFGNSGSVSDYNDFYIPNPVHGFLGKGNTTDFPALSDWQTALSGDSHSLEIDPMFAFPNDLHVINPALNSAGTPLYWVVTDIDQQMRNVVPDIGADEIFPADPSPVSLVNPTMPSCYTSSEPVVLRVLNAGNSALDFTQDTVPVTLTVSGTVSQTFNVLLEDNSRNNGDPLPVGGYADVLMGTINMTAGGTYIFNAHTSLSHDGNPYNDTMATTSIIVSPPQVNITGNALVCESASTVLTANASGGDGNYSYLWSYGMGTDSSVTFSPLVDTVYYVSILDGCGVFANDSIFIHIVPDPVADFIYNQNVNTVQFSDSSQNATNWSWNFGDSQSSNQQNPSHTYLSGGTYTVILTSTNSCGTDTATAIISIIETGINNLVENSGISVFPDPSDGQFTVFVSTPAQELEIDVEDVNGKLLQKNTFMNTLPGSNFPINVNEFENGIYFLRVYSSDFSAGQKIVIRK